MNREQQAEPPRHEPGADPSREDGLGPTINRIDRTEVELKREVAEAKEATEAAGHRLAGPLDDETEGNDGNVSR